MTVRKFRITSHAAQRMSQRNLDIGDICVVLQYGQLEYRAGAEFYFLGERDLPSGQKQQWHRLIGTTVVIEQGEITTVYRNKHAISRIKRKHKFDVRGSARLSLPSFL